MFLHSIARFFLGSFAQQKEEPKFPAHQSNQRINISPFFQLNQPTLMASLKALANEDILVGHIVADTNVSPFARARNICCGHKLCVWFCSETFCVRNKCFPVYAALETSWAPMCPQQCVLVYQAQWFHIWRMYSWRTSSTNLNIRSLIKIATTNHSPRHSAQKQMFSRTQRRLPHFEEVPCMSQPEQQQRQVKHIIIH